MHKRFIFGLFGALALTTATFADSSVQGTTLLEQISEAIAELAERSKPATVSIKCTICAQGQEYSNPFDMFGDDFFKRFFGQQNPQGQQQQTSGGSGFLVSPDGYIVTNNHVIKDATQVTVTLDDGREFQATVKGSDSRTDLAVIKIDTDNLPYLNFGDSDKLRAGDLVFALGNPFGLEGTITKGIVSAKGRQDLGIATYEDFIQTDAPINPGNSGGPLLNVRGEVIGVNTAIFSRSGGYMGIGLAIPSKMVQPVIDQIMNNGSVKRAYLGIVLQPIDKELSDAMNLDKADGVLISDVVKGSPAANAGIQQGDIILQYNGKPVKNVTKFRNDIAMMNPGQSIQLKIMRNGKPMTLTVELGCQNDGEVISAELTQKLGIELENLTPEWASRLGYSSDVNGIVISKVKQGSPAAMAGLRPSFLITGVAVDWNNQKPVKNIGEFDAALQELGDKKYIILIVRHQNFQRYYTIKLN
ncbi:MAG: DegQ family serine endoprotease [Parachlamydiales bacterium]|nr:DegQ family serine endoprotease [Parachlamydiales bacterium]